jgi:retron-type reverse transcriptase
VNYILNSDTRSFFDEVRQDWLLRFLGDRRIIRLVCKWLKAGVLEEEGVTVSDKGTGQGSVGSPLLANVYLHTCSTSGPHAGRREATGDMRC